MQWNWAQFHGSSACLKWAKRDLQSLVASLTYVRGRQVAVQAGGNLGIFPKRLAQEFESVYTFEPDPVLFAALVHNAPESNIVKLQAALGADHAPVRMECKRRDTSGRAIHEGLTHVAGAGNIPCLRIDDFQLAVCDLIYLDIEGWEYFALQGARETIQRCRPVIGVEVNRNILFAGKSPEDLRALIRDYGYAHVLTMHSDEIYIPAERP